MTSAAPQDGGPPIPHTRRQEPTVKKAGEGLA